MKPFFAEFWSRREGRLERAHPLKAHDPKSCSSANSDTPPLGNHLIQYILLDSPQTVFPSQESCHETERRCSAGKGSGSHKPFSPSPEFLRGLWL